MHHLSRSSHYRQLQPAARVTIASPQRQNHSVRQLKLLGIAPPMRRSIYRQAQRDAIADEIDSRPRKGQGVRSPLAVYRALLIKTHNTPSWP